MAAPAPPAAGDSAAVKSVKDFVSGSLAGFACKVVEFPFDTVKVLLQSDKAQNGNLYKGAVDCAVQTVRREGFLGMYRGMLTPIVGSMAENAVLFASFGLAERAASGLVPKGTLVESMVCGSFAGICVAHVLTPVEYVKCQLQVQNEPGKPKIYSGPVDCIRKTLARDGVRGFFTGHLATVLREMPGNAAWFGTYKGLCRLMTPEGKTSDDLKGYQVASAGGLAGMAYWTAFFPADTIKSLQQTSNARYEGKSFGSIFTTVYRENGLRGLYAGWGITVSRALPSNAVLFFTFEYVAALLKG